MVSFLCDLMITMMTMMITAMMTMMTTMTTMMPMRMTMTMMMLMRTVADAGSPFLISSLYLAFAHPQSPGSLLYFVSLLYYIILYYIILYYIILLYYKTRLYHYIRYIIIALEVKVPWINMSIEIANISKLECFLSICAINACFLCTVYTQIYWYCF